MKSLIQVSDIVCMLKKVFFLLHWEIRKAFSWGRKKVGGIRTEARGGRGRGGTWKGKKAVEGALNIQDARSGAGWALRERGDSFSTANRNLPAEEQTLNRRGLSPELASSTPPRPQAGSAGARTVFPSGPRVRPTPGGAWPAPRTGAREPQARAKRSAGRPGLGSGTRDGDLAAGRPADGQPAAAVRGVGGDAQPQPHRAAGARHRAGPGRRRARPRPGAVGRGASRLAGRGAPRPVEGERGGLPAPLPLQRRSTGRLPQVRAGHGRRGRGPGPGRPPPGVPRPDAARVPGIRPAARHSPLPERVGAPRARRQPLRPPKRSPHLFLFTFSWDSCPSGCSFVGTQLWPREADRVGRARRWKGAKGDLEGRSEEISGEMAPNPSHHPPTWKFCFGWLGRETLLKMRVWKCVRAPRRTCLVGAQGPIHCNKKAMEFGAPRPPRNWTLGSYRGCSFPSPNCKQLQPRCSLDSFFGLLTPPPKTAAF